MSGVTWGDDSARIRLFQTATRLSAHFYDAVATDAADQRGVSTDHVEDLNARWLLLDGDLTVEQYVRSLEKELLPLEGKWPFDHIRTELAKSFAHEKRLTDLNQKALDEVRKCLESWGGERAKKRSKALRLLPLHFESTDGDQMQFFFERSQKRILGRAGSKKCLFRECLILEFSFFHEYLSHVFPAWSKDVERVSEGFLFALEFDWFETAYTALDNELLWDVWQDRLGRERRSFLAGRWLLKRCKSRECMRRFLLEWVAGWEDSDEDENLDLLSQIQGVYNRTGHKLGGHLSAKQERTRELFDQVLCGPCEDAKWSIRKTRKELAVILSVYAPSR
jgi:hypothetical protein